MSERLGGCLAAGQEQSAQLISKGITTGVSVGERGRRKRREEKTLEDFCKAPGVLSNKK